LAAAVGAIIDANPDLSAFAACAAGTPAYFIARSIIDVSL
jgi:hypothetical protein